MGDYRVNAITNRGDLKFRGRMGTLLWKVRLTDRRGRVISVFMLPRRGLRVGSKISLDGPRRLGDG